MADSSPRRSPEAMDGEPEESRSTSELLAAPDDDEPWGPSEADLAEMYGGPPVREEDLAPTEASDLPSLEELRGRVPLKTQVLMEELFRAKLQKVQRINPRSLR